jgi:hypothetical protein
VVEVLETGIDTWGIGFDVSGELDARAIGARWESKSGCWVLAFPVAGHRVRFNPAHRRLVAEGRVGNGELVPALALSEAHRRVQEALEGLGVGSLVPAGLMRLDCTTTLGFSEPAEGRATLAGVAGLDPPRMKPLIHGRPIETVEWKTSGGKRTLATTYDKGLQLGTMDRWEAIRFEARHRFRSGARPRIEDGEVLDARALFQERFSPIWRSAKGVRVGGVAALVAELVERADQGEISPREAQVLIGYMLWEASAGKSMSRATEMRRRSALRCYGLVPNEDFLEPVQMDLAPILERALEAEW